METNEYIVFQIISAVGSARSSYIEAIQEAKKSNFEQAKNLMKEGAETFIQGHKAHAELISKEANGEKVEVSLLLAHAEDQLMSAEGFKVIAEEFISLYERISGK
ncbi:PTS lactose/cellobiose transporter subunit IIA [Neobacillus sp. WH10]|uniref:PTS lactose/cellobiose transporter subunit IIA n=1 Tax=Neobacillus sp. WH10 TaxID=3047873 RepID=UPI0024C11902|nr:PTS lactose/cellobiose transporter subunit IIA [Neobacillus sp. WH10]WHY79056.1 PTS lactose/cellobiose transporter subunit IIA [Neobacillus sp. WH10]